MRKAIIYTTNKGYDHFVELTKNLKYVKKIETDEKTLLMKEIKDAVDEMKLIRAGKKKARNAIDLLKEL